MLETLINEMRELTVHLVGYWNPLLHSAAFYIQLIEINDTLTQMRAHTDAYCFMRHFRVP